MGVRTEKSRGAVCVLKNTHTSGKAVINDKPAMRTQRISSGKVRRATRKQVASDKGLRSMCIFTEARRRRSSHSGERERTCKRRGGREGREDCELCVVAGRGGRAEAGRKDDRGLGTAVCATGRGERVCAGSTADTAGEERSQNRAAGPRTPTHPRSQRHSSQQLKGGSLPTDKRLGKQT